MAEILRTWGCQNARCNAVFDSWEPNPACPTCGCVRVGWVPAGGHIKSGTTQQSDRDLNHLLDLFKMRDINSARRDQRAMPALATPPPNAADKVVQFANGFAAPVNMNAAQCLPSSQHVDFKAKVKAGQALPKSGVPGPQTATRFEARHSGRP